MPGEIVSAVFILAPPTWAPSTRPRILIAVAKYRQHSQIHILTSLYHLLDRGFFLLHPLRRHRVGHPMMMFQNQIERPALLQIQPVRHSPTD